MKPRPREDWLLDHVNPIGTTACDDPAETLARIAVMAFEQAIGCATFFADSDLGAELMYTHLRRAWRFAEAARDLHDLYTAIDTPSEHLIVTHTRR